MIQTTNRPQHPGQSMEARVARIETYLFLLCQHFGLNPKTGVRLIDESTKGAQQ